MDLAQKIIEEKRKRLAQQRTGISKYQKDEKEKKDYHGYWLSKTKLHKTMYELDTFEIAIYENLWLYADKSGHCWPSIRLQAEKLRLDKNTVQTKIHSLEAKGFLKTEIRQGTQGKRFEYWLLK